MSQVPQTTADAQYGSSGLDDFGVTDAVLPRISIGHLTGVWKDNLTNSERPELRFIPLGLVKQRVLFHTNVEDGDVPMCKSSDFNLGFPNPDAPRQKSFPWDKSGFDPNDYPADEAGNRALPCNGCQLKDWGSHPNGTNPYCSEQWTLPIYYDASDDESGEWTPAILTLQKSQLKPIRTYLTAFKNSNRAPFLSVARAKLKVIERGQVTYSVPTFSKEEESPRDRWGEFAEQFEEMKTYLQRPPVKEDDGAAAPESDNRNTAPPQQQAPAPAADPQQAAPAEAPVPQQEQVTPPLAATQVAEPVQPSAPPAPAPAQAAPQPEPVQPAAPAAPAAQPQPQQPSGGQVLPF